MGVGLLADQVAFVTGAARGIGRAIAERFVQEGASVVLGDVDSVALESAVGEMPPHGPVTSGATVDVPAGDAAAIHSDQAVRVMIVGATADRPTYNPGMINGGVPPSMYDTTLGKPIFSVPNTSPVRWVDITGAVV